MENINQQEIDELFEGTLNYMTGIPEYLDGSPSNKLAALSETGKRYEDGEYGVLVSLTSSADRSPINIPDTCNRLILGELDIGDINVQPAAVKITAHGDNVFSAVMPGIDTLTFHNGALQEFAGRGDVIYHNLAFDWIWETRFIGERTEVICVDLRYLLAVLPKVGLAELAKKIIYEIGRRYFTEQEKVAPICEAIDLINHTLVD